MKKILIIEDEKILAEMYRDKFIQEGFEVISASSAEEGIKILKKHERGASRAKCEEKTQSLRQEMPDLILLDILLPGENGISFLVRIKKNPTFSSIPVLAFSNYDGLDTKKQAFKLGIKDYLIKTDYTPKRIVEKIKSYLNK